MNSLSIILKKELKELFRDKKSLAMMLIIPIFIPFIMIGLSFFLNMQMNKPIEEYNKIGFNYELSEEEKEIIKNINIDYSYNTKEELEELYKKGKIDLYIIKEDNKYIINGYDNETTSYSKMLVKTYLDSYKEYLQKEYLENKKLNSEEIINIINVEENIIVKENFFSSYIINYGFLFIVMAITIASTYPATDSTAGEKERGTLETLLTFPIRRKDIIIGKFLSVFISNLLTGLLSLILFFISLVIINNSFEIAQETNLILPLTSMIYAVIVIIAYSFLMSGLCISIASKSKTFKEAQSALTPLTFISFFPGMIAFMMHIKSSVIISIIPFLNYTVLFNDIVFNEVNIIYILLMFISTILFIVCILYIIIKQYKSEKILF